MKHKQILILVLFCSLFQISCSRNEEKEMMNKLLEEEIEVQLLELNTRSIEFFDRNMDFSMKEQMKNLDDFFTYKKELNAIFSSDNRHRDLLKEKNYFLNKIPEKNTYRLRNFLNYSYAFLEKNLPFKTKELLLKSNLIQEAHYYCEIDNSTRMQPIEPFVLSLISDAKNNKKKITPITWYPTFSEANEISFSYHENEWFKLENKNCKVFSEIEISPLDSGIYRMNGNVVYYTINGRINLPIDYDLIIK
ncbi:hypothetical protein [Aureivirga sp. CE67]|uniref:hypothetical protein n=1 Tax=Aureivirga sp. CE67 TaxID=1788983 RepID=UPI0018CA3BC7|nr:hypothetical protein [Aureivirga sp. CE67]